MASPALLNKYIYKILLPWELIGTKRQTDDHCNLKGWTSWCNCSIHVCAFLINYFMFLNRCTGVWLSWVTAVSGAVSQTSGKLFEKAFPPKSVEHKRNTFYYSQTIYILTASDPLLCQVGGWKRAKLAQGGSFTNGSTPSSFLMTPHPAENTPDVT